MVTVHRILCPTDFSGPSYLAVKAANELALHFSAELILVHVVTPFPFIPPEASLKIDVTSDFEEIEAAAESSLELECRHLISNEVPKRLRVLHGTAADEIVKTANDEHADMIVIATHGNKGLQRLLLGSVAEKVVRHASCPVLTVRVPHSSN